ncbi:S41 family peptidase [Telmatobacter bradus]|uniref:S41 family peptidase n=1 Tax=Telmatobacter bradus TaxID=474953 RepID=UPI003B43298D
MSRLFQRFVFVVSVVIFAALGLGFGLGELGFFGVHAGSDQDGAYKQVGVYADVLKKIQTDYVTEPNMGDVTTGAMHGLLESLDADSSYLTPTEYKIYTERSAATGVQVGLTVAKRYGYALVVNVRPGSPADKEQIKNGDVIEAIDGQSSHDLAPAVIRLMLAGKPGSTVTLAVVRQSQSKADPDKITLTRAETPAPALAVQNYENQTILSLKPGVLTAERVDEIAAKIKAAPKGTKILLDLRDTTGEDLQLGLRLANLFLKQGTMATLSGQQFPQQSFVADPAKCLTDAPLVVLVNRGTYGAPELTAAALLDLKRANVVGEHTFGEGSVQKTFNLNGGAALLLTVAKYQTAGGKKIQDDAVTPDITVGNQNEEDEDATSKPAPSKTDVFLDKALELLKSKNS